MNEQLPNDPHCPVCNERIDGYTGFDQDKVGPKAGDLSVCLYCGTVMEYRGAGKFIELGGQAREDAIAECPPLKQAIEFVTEFRRKTSV